MTTRDCQIAAVVLELLGFGWTCFARNDRLRRPDRRVKDALVVGSLATAGIYYLGGGRSARAFAAGALRPAWGEARETLAKAERERLDPVANELFAALRPCPPA